MMRKLALIAATALWLACPALAQPAAPVASASIVPPPNAPPPHAVAPGPYAVAIDAPPNMLDHTVFRPADLKASGKIPIVAWGNGACSSAGLNFQVFLTQIASHGYFIVVSGAKDTPVPNYTPGAPRPAVQPPMTTDKDMIRGLDFAFAENARKDSPYFGRLDTSKVAVMGQSCGGLQATAAGGDPRVKTVVIWNSGTFNNRDESAPTGAAVRSLSSATKDSLKAFHTPVAYFLGGATDIAYANGSDDFTRVTVPAFLGSINSGHGGTYRHPNGGWFGETGVKWLDWQLKGDRKAAAWFVGADCVLCKNPIWEVRRKNLR